MIDEKTKRFNQLCADLREHGTYGTNAKLAQLIVDLQMKIESLELKQKSLSEI